MVEGPVGLSSQTTAPVTGFHPGKFRRAGPRFTFSVEEWQSVELTEPLHARGGKTAHL